MAPSITDRSPSYRVDLAVEALHGEPRYGKVVRLSEWYGVSRQTVHSVRQRAQEALDKEFGKGAGPSAGGPHCVGVDRGRLERTVLAAHMDGATSVGGIQAILEEAFDLQMSAGQISSVTREAQRRARRFNQGVSLKAVEHVALDEMFSRGAPMFAGVDLDSFFVFLLEMRERPSGEEWDASLQGAKQRGLAPSVVAKDAGSGLHNGVSQALPEAEQQADVFHALRAMGQASRHLEQRAYKEIAVEHKVECEPVRWGPGAPTAKSRVLRRRHARARCTQVVQIYDTFEALRREATVVLDLVDVETQQLRTSADSAAQLERIGQAMIALGHKRTRKVGNYISRQAHGLVAYQDRVVAALTQAASALGGFEAVRLAALLWQLGQLARREPRNDRRRPLFERGVMTLALLTKMLGDRCQETRRRVHEIIDRRARGSSLVETFNGIARRHEKMHKGIDQGFLELLRAWHNLRTFRGGKRKGKSPLELLTGETVPDWLAALGYPPRGPLTSARKVLARDKTPASTNVIALPRGTERGDQAERLAA